jgi:hypothetical protein
VITAPRKLSERRRQNVKGRRDRNEEIGTVSYTVASRENVLNIFQSEPIFG